MRPLITFYCCFTVLSVPLTCIHSISPAFQDKVLLKVIRGSQELTRVQRRGIPLSSYHFNIHKEGQGARLSPTP